MPSFIHTEKSCGFKTEKVENRRDSALGEMLRVSNGQHYGIRKYQRRQGESHPGSTM